LRKTTLTDLGHFGKAGQQMGGWMLRLFCVVAAMIADDRRHFGDVTAAAYNGRLYVLPPPHHNNIHFHPTNVGYRRSRSNARMLSSVMKSPDSSQQEIPTEQAASMNHPSRSYSLMTWNLLAPGT
jgi:hypothetical protein